MQLNALFCLSQVKFLWQLDGDVMTDQDLYDPLYALCTGAVRQAMDAHDLVLLSIALDLLRELIWHEICFRSVPLCSSIVIAR
jgi:hypothetical protein